ncbi:uncharacterized protein LOC143188374 [Calliopsis andreniformis]|uniref:uncharacterized protein LOC143188374 n=1 Tax=Calliopsis andreniformis TaxID=337506 RepID=UPI003FCDBAC4
MGQSERWREREGNEKSRVKREKTIENSPAGAAPRRYDVTGSRFVRDRFSTTTRIEGGLIREISRRSDTRRKNSHRRRSQSEELFAEQISQTTKEIFRGFVEE